MTKKRIALVIAITLVMIPLIIIQIRVSFFPRALKIIYYTYQGVTVTRMDKGDKVYFYYGRCGDKDQACANPNVIIEWRKTLALRGFLLFHSDKTVEVLKGGGGYYTVPKNGGRSVYMEKYESPRQWHDLMDQFRDKNYNNLVELSNSIKFEQEMNQMNRSKVKVDYFYIAEGEE